MIQMLIAALVLFVAAMWPSDATAQIYRYVDERGTPHYVDGVDNVPERFRAFLPGRHILVEARINDSTAVKLILDTGAANTLISPRALAAAGVSLTRGVRTARTRGVARDTEVEVQQVPISSISVGEARVANLVVSSYEMDMPEAEGLLGQDFLGNFNVSIDSGSGVVKLTKK